MSAPTYLDTATCGCLIALSSLPGVGPARLRALLETWDPVEAWAQVTSGRAAAHPRVAASLRGAPATLADSWRRAAAALDPLALAASHDAHGIAVVSRSHPDLPEVLRADPAPPDVLFTLGERRVLGEVSVAIVGTRRCTRYGHDVARRLGAELVEAGVHVVSGLAQGIDGAAHRGALAATGPGVPIGVVGSGLDVAYPARNRALWHEVAERGVLVSEAPLGAAPDAWRFPARNRIIAALAQVVVVVESHASGGSLLTVEEAATRGREVLAVPGPITSPAAVGTNRLLADGARPVLATSDVLDAIGHDGTSVRAPTDFADAATRPDADEARVLDELSAGPRTLGELAAATGFALPRLSLVLTVLEVHGVLQRSGGYFERVHAPGSPGTRSEGR